VKPEKWESIKELFGLALEREPNQRAGFLEEACAGDRALQAEVESLLASYQTTRGPAGGANSLPDSTTASVSEAAEVMAGRRIGPYQVIREIGHGGMATVYLAVRADDQYRKRVAIKLVRPGLSGEEILRRFRNERQTLAALDHSNIVKLLDGGRTEEGLPYLVMEYIEGAPIDEYCDSLRLTITERLQLFRTVCGAVQYAHQNLVIHRDLKPSNILVTSEGVPKLLDFGIAKLLNPELSAQSLLVTQAGVRMMTPEYASPEQIRGLPLTTATDIYSLGVMLYQLLSGHRPYRLKSQTPLEIERVICEEEPEKPSVVVTWVEELDKETRLTPEEVSRTREGRPEKLWRRLQGDLDTIVLMALRKEPARRYASVEQFSEDIRRHLENLPVAARKPTLAYRAAKFTRRHKAGVASAALVVLVLIGGITTTTWEARVARREKARAERRFEDVRELANSFISDFPNTIENFPESTLPRKLMVQMGLKYLDKLTKDPSSDSSVLLDQANGYIRIGDMQGNPYYKNLGDADGALASYRKAEGIIASLLHDRPNDPRTRRPLANVLEKSAYQLSAQGQPREAVARLRKAAEIYQELAGAAPKDARAQLDVATCYNGLGDVLGNDSFVNVGDKASALESYSKALGHYQAAVGLDSGNRRTKRGLAIGYFKVGDMNLQVAGGQPSKALEMFGKALAIFEELSSSDPANADFRRNIAIVHERIGQTLVGAGNLRDALDHYQKTLAIERALVAADSKNVQARVGLAITLRNIGEALEGHGDSNGALALYRDVISILEALAAEQPGDIQWRSRLSEILVVTGTLAAKQGQLEDARHMTSRGLQLERALADRAEASPDEPKLYAMCLLDCEPADVRDPPLALKYARRALELAGGKDPELLDLVAKAYFRTGHNADAVEAEQNALALLAAAESGKAPSPTRRQFEANLARYQVARKRE
jgi:eukaryotic-like serine/threonine-protein kinase